MDKYVRYLSKKTGKVQLYFNCEKWEELWVSHATGGPADPTQRHFWVISFVFYTGPTGLNVSTFSIVENKNSTQTSGLQWLWSSYAHVTLLFLIWLMRNWNVINFKWLLEGWFNLIWSYRALISGNSLETLMMILCRTLLRTAQQFTSGFSFSGINEIQAVLFYYYSFTIIVLINILLHGNIFVYFYV